MKSEKNEKTNVKEEAKCFVCGKTGKVMQCSQCKTARYCSREHQVQDWKRHAKECRLATERQKMDICTSSEEEEEIDDTLTENEESEDESSEWTPSISPVKR